MKDFPAKTTANLQALTIPKEEVEPPYDEDDDMKKPAKKLMKVQARQKSKLQAIFVYDKIKVDVFIENNFSESTLTIDGIKHTTIKHILQAKKSYFRMKDWMQCRDMARIFFKQEEFDAAINSDWKSLLRDKEY